MKDLYVVHDYQHAHDGPEYTTGHIEFAATCYKQCFSSYAGLLLALSGTVAAGVNEPFVAGQGSHWNS